MGLYDKAPRIKSDVFIAPSASVQGEVSVGSGSSIWYGAIVRGAFQLVPFFHLWAPGENNIVSIGNNTSIHDRVIILSSNPKVEESTTIGENVSIGKSFFLAKMCKKIRPRDWLDLGSMQNWCQCNYWCRNSYSLRSRCRAICYYCTWISCCSWNFCFRFRGQKFFF